MAPELSIVIPTLNEEKYLPKLLASLVMQTYSDFEVVVVDGDSRDKTAEIAKSFNKILSIKTIIEKERSIGLARNCGGEAAKGKYILFLDADVILDDDFLERALIEFKYRNLDIATARMRPLSSRNIDFLIRILSNTTLLVCQYFFPLAFGFCILCKKEVFDITKGFDSTIKLGEDSNFIKKAAKKNFKFRVLMRPKIPVSVRRLDRDGRLKTVIKYYTVVPHWILVGEVRDDRFKYRFGEYE